MSTSRTREKADGELFKSTGIDDNATSTAVTIDASQNVLVGQTSLNTANNGHSFGANGNYAHHTSTESTTLILNRKTSDGDIVRLRKDNVAVGSIGTYGSALYIASPDGSDAGLRIGNSYISPVTTTGVNRDAGIDLGHSNSRFKDLYLSGGVYLGGTGAANKLDDYETATWTLTDQSGAGMSLNVYVAEYTKIGNKVFFEIGMEFPTTSSTADIRLSLPFTAKSTGDNTGGATVSGTSSGRNDLWLVSRGNAFIMAGNNLNSSGASNHPKNTSYSGKQLKLQGQYTAA
jgi:hypothetical protein